MKSIKYYFPGLIMILMAFLIIAAPELLFALVAGAMVMIGLGLLYAGHLIRKSEIEFHRIGPWGMADPFFDHPGRKSPFVRIWYRNF